jgi:type II secretory pathway pseudopilin PulG
MRSFITHQITNLSLASLIVSGCLVLSSQYQQAQAQVLENQLLLAQTAASNYYEGSITPQTWPSEQQTEAVEFSQNNQPYQSYPNTQISQYGQNFGQYIVYVDTDDRGTLQRIKQIESTAYIRSINGRRIIQSGVFTRPDNAQRRVQELASNGIIGAGIMGDSYSGAMSYSSPPAATNYNYMYNNPVPNYSYSNNNFSSYPNLVQNPSNYYYVVIPTSLRNLSSLGQEIQQKIGGNISVFPRTQPRGSHIAVGRFQERYYAEQVKDYLKTLGYGNARVYYGR